MGMPQQDSGQSGSDEKTPVSNTQELFKNLIWPAAAGNVAWSVFALAIAPDCGAKHVCARLVVLFLLAGYLTYSYTRLPRTGNVGYWIADGLHVLAIVVFALAVESNRTWIEVPLYCVFAVTIVGHLSGVFLKSDKCEERFYLAGCSLLGVVVLWGIPRIVEGLIPWHLPIAVGTTLVAWSITNWRLGRLG